MERACIKKSFLFFCALLPLSFLSACSFDVSIQSIVDNLPEIIQSKTSGEELVPASQQGVVTAQGYTVQSSVSFQSGKSQVMTSQGYQINTNVQSNIFKD